MKSPLHRKVIADNRRTSLTAMRSFTLIEPEADGLCNVPHRIAVNTFQSKPLRFGERPPSGRCCTGHAQEVFRTKMSTQLTTRSKPNLAKSFWTTCRSNDVKEHERLNSIVCLLFYSLSIIPLSRALIILCLKLISLSIRDSLSRRMVEGQSRRHNVSTVID